MVVPGTGRAVLGKQNDVLQQLFIDQWLFLAARLGTLAGNTEMHERCCFAFLLDFSISLLRATTAASLCSAGPE